MLEACRKERRFMGIKFSAFIATSLDGYIARKNGDLDWLPGSDGTSTGEDHGYRDFFAAVDTLVMGRNTYELVMSFKEWPYPGQARDRPEQWFPLLDQVLQLMTDAKIRNTKRCANLMCLGNLGLQASH